MTLLYFLLSFVAYCVVAALPYTSFKDSKWYYILAISGLFTQGLWLAIAKLSKDNHDLLFRGIYFDLMITAIYLAIPLLLFDVQLTKGNERGLGLIGSVLIVSKL